MSTMLEEPRISFAEGLAIAQEYGLEYEYRTSYTIYGDAAIALLEWDLL